MKQLEQILREIEARKLFCLVGSQRDIAIELAKTFAIEVAKKSLENAYQSALKESVDGPECALLAIVKRTNIPKI